MRRLVALSSTTSTGRPRSAAGSGRPFRGSTSACAVAGWTPRRAVKWNTLPAPGSLSTHRRPPIRDTSCTEIVSPRPVPPYLRVVDVSACENASKIAS